MKILFFTQASCQPCRRVKPVMRQIAEEYNVDIDELDIAQHVETARQFNIMSTPTMIVIDNDGLEIRRVTGAKPKVDMVDALELDRHPDVFDGSTEVQGVITSRAVKKDNPLRGSI